MRLIVVRKVLLLSLIACGLGAWAQDQPAIPAQPATPVPPAPAAQGALLSGKGAVTVNGQLARSSQAVLPGDLVVTPADGGANVTLDGTSLLFVGGTAARYEGISGMTLERGAMSVSTQKGFVVRTGCLSVAPVEPDQWTDYAVTDLEGGMVSIVARKGAVNVLEAGKTDRLDAGQQATRPGCAAEQRERARRKPGAAPAASTGPLNSNIAVYSGVAAAGGLTIYILTRNPAPVSPDKP